MLTTAPDPGARPQSGFKVTRLGAKNCSAFRTRAAIVSAESTRPGDTSTQPRPISSREARRRGCCGKNKTSRRSATKPKGPSAGFRKNDSQLQFAPRHSRLHRKAEAHPNVNTLLLNSAPVTKSLHNEFLPGSHGRRAGLCWLWMRSVIAFRDHRSRLQRMLWNGFVRT